MGRHFGTLGTKIHGLIFYTISPFEQKTFAGVLSVGIPNTFRRMKGQIFRVVPPFILGYMVYDYGEKENYRQSRKNPADFENET